MLAARCAAWLSTSPKKADGSKDECTWAERIDSNGGKHPYPPEVKAEYLLGYLQDMGMVSSTGMGLAALSSSEIMAWQQCNAIHLTPWEFSAIRGASRAYVAEFYAESDVPPVGGISDLSDPDVITRKLMAAFDRLK